MLVGMRFKDAVRLKERAIRIYVVRKKPRSKLKVDECLPKRVHLITPKGTRHHAHWVRVDVEEVGKICAAYQPIIGGSEVLVPNCGSGTVGLRFTNRADEIDYILTCGHVVAPDGHPAASLEVRADANTVVDGLAPVILPLDLNSSDLDGPQDNIDAALFQLKDPGGRRAGNLRIRQFRDGIAQLSDPKPNDNEEDYRLYSRMRDEILTGWSLEGPGVVQVELPARTTAWLSPVWSLRMKAQQGDSGSILVNHNTDGQLQAVGMLVAVTDTRSYFHPIRKVLRSFESSPTSLQINLGVPGDV
jgi:hypothetical protein